MTTVKLLFDANCLYRLVKKLEDVFPASLHVERTGLPIPASDREIWQFAKEQDFVLITQDEDFCELSLLYGSPPKVCWLRFGNAPTDFVAQKLREHSHNIYELHTSRTETVLEIY